MAYCALTDIQGMFPHITFGTTSKPTATQVQAEIDRAAGLMDAKLATRYAVPCDTADGADSLKSINRLLAAAAVDDLVHGTLDGTTTDRAGAWRDQAEDALDTIINADTPAFQDATAGTASQPRGNAFSEVGTYRMKDSTGVERSPMMTRDKQF